MQNIDVSKLLALLCWIQQSQWEVYYCYFTNEQIVLQYWEPYATRRMKTQVLVLILLVTMFYGKRFEHTHTHTSLNKYLLATKWIFLELRLLKLVPVKQLACGIYADGLQQPIASCACQTFKQVWHLWDRWWKRLL